MSLAQQKFCSLNYKNYYFIQNQYYIMEIGWILVKCDSFNQLFTLLHVTLAADIPQRRQHRNTICTCISVYVY